MEFSVFLNAVLVAEIYSANEALSLLQRLALFNMEQAFL